MTAITTNVQGYGTQWISSPGDNLHVLSSGLLGSWDTLTALAQDDNLRVDNSGEMWSMASVLEVQGSDVRTANYEGGLMQSESDSHLDAVIRYTGEASYGEIYNLGTINAFWAVGVEIGTDHTIFDNRGMVNAGSAFRMGLDGGDGQVVRNFGTMVSTGNASALGDATYGNGVYIEGSNNLFNNWFGSTLTVTGGGAGVAFGGSGTGLSVKNAGLITSDTGWGVDLSGLATGFSADVINTRHGVIEGGAGGVRGNSADNYVANLGIINGDVYLFGGDDKVSSGTYAQFNGDLYAGNGNDTLFGSGGDDTFFGQGDDDEIWGFDGDDFLFGGSGGDVINGGKDADYLRGQGGNDTLNGGFGDDDIYGGAGADVFVFEVGGDFDIVWDFQNNLDQIDLRDLGIANYSDLAAVMTTVGADVQIDLSTLSFQAGDMIELRGVSISVLDSSDFIL
ncbi:calcium-binding protein [Octadecabacter sp. R77987]|uniref:calcium-binding protein n=1 Tax=Octadecabacter sp. R77987 TaxID=3093874 RepID=UPI00366D8AEF